jgi:hypothetical protein
MIPCGFRLILEQEFERAQDFQSWLRVERTPLERAGRDPLGSPPDAQ